MFLVFFHDFKGTVLYEMVVGSPPYYDDDLKVMYRNIDEGNLQFPSNLSLDAQDLIRVEESLIFLTFLHILLIFRN